MVIPIPDLKTTYEATKTSNNSYPQDWDSDNAKLIQGFEAIDAALDNVLAAQGIQFVADYRRRISVSDPPNQRVGGDCFKFQSDVASAGTFTIEADNATGIHVAYIGDQRKSHVGDFDGDLVDLITAGEIVDQGGGAWTGTVYIGMDSFGQLDLALGMSTSSGNVDCPVHELDVSVAGIGGTPSFAIDKYKLFADGRETIWSGTERDLTLETPVVFERSFETGGASEAIVYVPFEHIIVSGYGYVEEDGVNYSASIQIERMNPTPVEDFFASALTFSGNSAAEGPATFVGSVPQSTILRQIQSSASFYRLHHPSLAAAPTRWRVGLLVKLVHGGHPL